MVLKQRCLGSFDSICRQPPPIERKGLFPEGRGIICARGGTLGRTEEGEGSLNLKDTQRGIKAGSRWRWWLWRWWSDWLTAIQPNLTDKITLCLLWIHPETHPTSPPPPIFALKKLPLRFQPFFSTAHSWSQAATKSQSWVGGWLEGHCGTKVGGKMIWPRVKAFNMARLWHLEKSRKGELVKLWCQQQRFINLRNWKVPGAEKIWGPV